MLKVVVQFCLCFFIFSSCIDSHDSSSFNSGLGERELKESTFPEPHIKGEDTTVRFKFVNQKKGKDSNELNEIDENEWLQITDIIEFPDLEEQVKNQKFLEEVSLNINSRCNVFPEKVFVKESVRDLSSSIPLIELLPEEALASSLTHNSDLLPFCSVSIEAKLRGEVLFFELPLLPIRDYYQSNSITFFDPPETEKTKEYFYSILVQDKSNYRVDIDKREKSINKLTLNCNAFSRTVSLHSEDQFVPFSIFELTQSDSDTPPFEPSEFATLKKDPLDIDTSSLDLAQLHNNSIQDSPNSIQDFSNQQICRIFGYRDQVLVAVSSVLRLFFTPPESLKVHIKPALKKWDKRFALNALNVSQRITDGNPQDFPLYSYRIKNPFPYPVHILIGKDLVEDQKKRISVYGIYWGSYNERKHPFILSSITSVSGFFSKKNTSYGTVVTIYPEAEVLFSAILKKGFRLCNKGGNVFEYMVATVFRYPDLKMYHIAHPNMDLNPPEKNILYQLKTKSGSFSLISNSIVERTLKAGNNSLWFEKKDCNGKVISLKTWSIIRLRYLGINDEHLSARWHHPKSVPRSNYKQTNSFLYKIFYRPPRSDWENHIKYTSKGYQIP